MPTDEENWKNKNKKTAVVTKSRRAIQSMLNPMVDICSSIILLRNGFFSTAGKFSIQTMNTCPFDSFYVIVASMYADYVQVKNQIDQLAEHCIFSKMISNTFTTGETVNSKQKKLLRERNLVLLHVFKDLINAISFTNGLISINSAANCHFIIDKLLSDHMSSYTRIKQCTGCKKENVSNRPFVDINFELYNKLGIQKLNECLLQTLISEPSGTCNCSSKSEIITHTRFSNFIAIDLQLYEDIKEISLNEIPEKLNILGIQFSLVGCIEFRGNCNDHIRIGHYVAHVYRPNKRWELYDDTQCKVAQSNLHAKIQGQILIYVKQG